MGERYLSMNSGDMFIEFLSVLQANPKGSHHPDCHLENTQFCHFQAQIF